MNFYIKFANGFESLLPGDDGVGNKNSGCGPDKSGLASAWRLGARVV
jgi:hypothetical protein